MLCSTGNAYPLLLFQFWNSRSGVKATPSLRRSSRRSFVLGSTVIVVGRNTRRLGISGATPGCPRCIGGANVTSAISHRRCHIALPARIKVHDAIDFIVAQVVDYYGSSRSLR